MDHEEEIVDTLKSGEDLKEKLCAKVVKYARSPNYRESLKKQRQEIL